MKPVTPRSLALWTCLSSIPGILAFQHADAGKSVGVGDNDPSNLTTLTPQFFSSYGSERTEIRYGPFTVDGMMTNNGMNGMSRRDPEYDL